VSVTHSVSLRGRGNLGFSLLRSTSKRSNNAAFVTYTQAFGRGRTLASSGMASRGAGQHHSELRATVNQATPTDRGAGWRVGATEGGDYDAWWQQRFEAADLELQASRSSARSGQSVLLSGGVSRLEGTWRAARSMQGSFALVDLGGIADVPVYLENRPVGKTDANGYVVLPNLLPYVPNRITISPEDLPLDAAISARTMVVSPARRSGVLARVPVEKIHPAVFRLALPDDTPVPAGAEVQLNGGHFVVAMAGLTYVTTLDRNSSGYATWPNGSCSFHVDAPVSQDPQPDLGVIRCVPTVVAAQ
jgi:outer membrane usher protein